MTDLPSTDDLAKQADSLPTTDDLASQALRPQTFSGELSDHFFSDIAQPVSHILSAFGQGAQQGWGAVAGSPLPEDTQADLAKTGGTKLYQDGTSSVLKSANESWMRSAAHDLWTLHPFGLSAIPSPQGVVAGASALMSGIQGAGEQTAEELGKAGEKVSTVPYVGKALQFPLGVSGEILSGYLNGAGLEHFSLPQELAQARSIGGIAESEDHFLGTKEPTPELQAARAEATGQLIQDTSVHPDIHAAARELAPQEFARYDDWSAQAETFQKLVDQGTQEHLQSPEVTAAQKGVDDILDRVNGNEEELSDQRAEELSTAREKLEDALSNKPAELVKNESQLNDINRQINEISPDIRTAYQQASDSLGNPSTASTEPTQPGSGLQGTDTAPVQKTPQELSQGTIAQDVQQKLIAAGRPADEAAQAGILWQQRFETRAAQSPHLGTADEIYQREGADILPGRVTKTADGIKLPAVRRGARGSLVKGSDRNIVRLFDSADSSTFLHETGHQWLEELMKDSSHPEASEGLKADAQAARDFLKNTGEDLTRAQHEKFARTFERYLREGHAPTPELASVFQKFKDWLTKVYQTLKDLPNSKLSPEIRSVFDNLIVPGRDRTVIIRDSSENLKPIDSLEQRKPMTASGRDEAILNYMTAAETRANAIRVAKTEVKEGDAEVKPEKPVSGPAKVSTNNGTFKTDSSFYIDSTGKARIENINSDSDLDQFQKFFYDKHREEIDKARGKISDQDRLDAADTAGISPKSINMEALKQAANNGGIPLSAYVSGLRSAIESSATAIKGILEGTLSQESAIEYAIATNRHLELVKKFMNARAEWGRTGQALNATSIGLDTAEKVTEFLQANIGKSLEQVQKEMLVGKQLDTPQKVSKFVNDMTKPSGGEMLLEYFRNTLISGPITHMTYAAGNKVYALYKAFPETLAKAGVGYIHELLAGHPIDRAYAGEAKAGLGGMIFGQWDGLKAAGKSFKAGQTLGLPGEGSVADLAIKRALSEKLVPGTKEFLDRVDIFKHRIAEEVVGKRGITDEDELNQAVEDQKKSLEPVDHRFATPFTQTKAIPGIAGTILRAPGERMVAPVHSFDRTVGYLTNRSQLIYRQAASEGLTGQAMARRIAELENDTPEMLMYQARQEATEQALMGRAGGFTRSLQGWLNWQANLPSKINIPGTSLSVPFIGRVKPLSFADPFVGVISNVNKAAVLDRSPIGIASEQIRKDLSGVNGTLAQDTAIAKMGLGSAVWGTVIAGLMQSYFNGPAPQNYDEARIHQAIYGLPHSVRIGDMSYDLSKLGVPGKIISSGLDLAAAVKDWADHDDFKKAAMGYFHSMSQNFLQEGPMSGIGEMLSAAENSGKDGASYVQNFLSSALLPFSVGMSQMAHQVDPYQREADGLMQSILAKIPFASEELQQKIDIFGQPIPNKEYWGVYATQVDNDPVYKALEGAGYFPAPVKKQINGVQLDNQQYHDYAVKAGIATKLILNWIVALPNFNQMSVKTRHDLMVQAVSQGRQTGEAQLIARDAALKGLSNPDSLIQKINNFKKGLTH